ncbi:MAG: Coenzyme F420 hydrogenase/dehydrogenase, beta subunit C-terminal domain [Clostridia bacterium]|nr:Coenzyme F420 hydrogenase/dehydrogenase, beta subunit C-terminal domain [Clostridia bacterium]
MNVSEISGKNCSGCGLCAAVCPKNAIKMENKDFFLHPVVSAEKCVDCGICFEKCPHNSFKREENSEKEVYSAWLKDQNLVSQSSSGGLFFALAKSILQKGGKVCGSVYDDGFCGAKHIVSDDISDIMKMRTSKYVQSKTEGVFGEIKKALDENIPVLFTGTPCQAAAVKNFIGENENLYFATLICHGPTSDEVLKAYVSELENKENSKITGFNMRKKVKKWLPMYIEASFENGNVKTEALHLSTFGRIFQSYVLMRESCYECGYKDFPLIGDVVIGDYKGIENITENYNKMGVSCVIVCTEKGKELFESISEDIDFQKQEIDAVIKYNQRLTKPVPKPDQKIYEKFVSVFKNGGVSAAADFIKPNKSLLQKVISKILRK